MGKKIKADQCAAIAEKTGLPPVCGACNLGPCPNYVKRTDLEQRLIDALREIYDLPYSSVPDSQLYLAARNTAEDALVECGEMSSK